VLAKARFEKLIDASTTTIRCLFEEKDEQEATEATEKSAEAVQG
jgi:hypothetical protein